MLSPKVPSGVKSGRGGASAFCRGGVTGGGSSLRIGQFDKSLKLVQPNADWHFTNCRRSIHPLQLQAALMPGLKRANTHKSSWSWRRERHFRRVSKGTHTVGLRTSETAAARRAKCPLLPIVEYGSQRWFECSGRGLSRPLVASRVGI